VHELLKRRKKEIVCEKADGVDVFGYKSSERGEVTGVRKAGANRPPTVKVRGSEVCKRKSV